MKRIITVLTLALLAAACTMKPAPYPQGAVPCVSDWDCSDNQHCGFPYLPKDSPYTNSRAQCLPGNGDARWEMGDPPFSPGH